MALTKLPKNAIADGAVKDNNIADGTIQNQDISGSISNDKLANSSFTLNGTEVSLGAPQSVTFFLDWQAVTVADGSTQLNVESGKGYFLDTNAGTIEVKLPSSPTRGDVIGLVDYAGTFGTNRLIINNNGVNIDSTVGEGFEITTNNAIVELVYVDAAKGWLVYLNQAAGTTPSGIGTPGGVYDATHITATGGTITTLGNYKIHTFTGDGCFSVAYAGAGTCASPSNVDYLVVAGGGGGGRNSGGGGGAGGYRTTFPSPGCNAGAFPISATTYPISVGAGGAAGNPNCDGEGCSGSQAIFATITSAGGGGGGSPTTPPGVGLNGGSGGGGGPKGFPFGSCGHLGGSGNTPPVSPPQGNNGGRGAAGPNCGGATGGGGGASATGTNAVVPGSAPSTNMGGCGGAGSPNSITGSAVTYAGGGGGSKFYTPGAGIPVPSGAPGGVGGGGDGGAQGASPSGPNNGTSATANTGGGGGAGGNNGAAGNGGKGIVIIRYKFQ